LIISCRRIDCANEVKVDGLKSTDGERKAFVFLRNCGATVGVNTQVSLLEAYQDLPNDAGNTFICDQPSASVQIKWMDAHTLQIIYPEKAKVFLQRESLHGARISYVAKP
jgi:hypothetical protein